MSDAASSAGWIFTVSLATFYGAMIFFRPTGATVAVSGWAGAIALVSGLATLMLLPP